MVNNAVVSHNSVNELYYLEEVDSTNTWAKANLDKFGPVGAVYTTSQTAGRGRRGHTWINASGQALYYTVVLKTELAQPESLPLFASMAVADALEQRYGIQCQGATDIALTKLDVLSYMDKIPVCAHYELRGQQTDEFPFPSLLPEAKPVLMEPIGELKVTIPDSYLGDVMGDLNKRRGRVMGMNPTGDGEQVLEAEVPMAEMMSYAIDLRSMTQSRGTFTFNFVRYEDCPAAAQEKAIAEAKALAEAE